MGFSTILCYVLKGKYTVFHSKQGASSMWSLLSGFCKNFWIDLKKNLTPLIQIYVEINQKSQLF